MNESSVVITYQVQYQEKGKDDWHMMTCRNPGERFHSEVQGGMYELFDVYEAIEIAKALEDGTANPHRRGESYRRPIVAARWITIVRSSRVSAVYGTPNVDVPRETSAPANAHEALMELLRHDHPPTQREWDKHMEEIKRLAEYLDDGDVSRETTTEEIS